jgi:glycosyltransferase involved in cell wall biosynthesis
MRILIASRHRYPADNGEGTGWGPRAFPSGSGFHILDLTVRGLAELGHDVVYLLPQGWDREMSLPVTMVKEPRFDVDLAHVLAYLAEGLLCTMDQRGVATIVSCHRDPHLMGEERGLTGDNWIYVSQSLAEAFGSSRFVLNGLDPEDYIFDDDKQDYLLFMAALEWAPAKGLDLALSLAREAGIRLVVAGTGQTEEIIAQVGALCQLHGADFVGDVRGRDKARLFASATAFLFPTQVAEAFGLCMVEAMMSGTPVIASDFGACPEIVTPDVGFVCRTREDYLVAIARCRDIPPKRCRSKALHRFHYKRMVADYVREYQIELDRRRVA